MNFIGVIFARGNSKGIKNKNLLKFKNISLVEHAVRQAKKIKILKQVYISSDSKKIIKAAKKQKAIVPFIRPRKISNDKSPEILAWRHFVEYLISKNISVDYIVSIPTTSPLRKLSDIQNCINLAKKKKYDFIYTITKSSKNPYFNSIGKIKKKFSLLKWKNKNFFRRQDAPKFYDITTVCYVFKPKFVLKNLDMFSGKVGFVEIPKNRAIDVDDKFDYKLVRLLTKK